MAALARLGFFFALGVNGLGGVLSKRSKTSSSFETRLPVMWGRALNLFSGDQHIKPRRRRWGQHVPNFAKYTTLAGQVTWASNNLHAQFFYVLCEIFPRKKYHPKGPWRPDGTTAEEIWHSLRSDDLQRTVLRAVAIHSASLTERRRRSLLWAIDAAGTLSQYRNDAIHTEFSLDWGEGLSRTKIKFVPGIGHPKRIERLERVGFSKLFRLLIGDYNQLADYVSAIWLNSMDWEGTQSPPLPKRPVLRSVLLVQKSPPTKNTPKSRSQSPKRQRRSSQG